MEKVKKDVDKHPIKTYIYSMKEINIKVSNISQKQWSLLLVELNLVSENWKKYGPIINIKAKNFGKTNLLEKTKDPKYKNLWYEYIREFTNGPHNIKRWTVPTNSSDKRDNAKHKIIK